MPAVKCTQRWYAEFYNDVHKTWSTMGYGSLYHCISLYLREWELRRLGYGHSYGRPWRARHGFTGYSLRVDRLSELPR